MPAVHCPHFPWPPAIGHPRPLRGSRCFLEPGRRSTSRIDRLLPLAEGILGPPPPQPDRPFTPPPCAFYWCNVASGPGLQFVERCLPLGLVAPAPNPYLLRAYGCRYVAVWEHFFVRHPNCGCCTESRASREGSVEVGQHRALPCIAASGSHLMDLTRGAHCPDAPRYTGPLPFHLPVLSTLSPTSAHASLQPYIYDGHFCCTCIHISTNIIAVKAFIVWCGR